MRAFLCAAVIALTGCGSIDGKDPPERDADEWYYITVPVPDGRPVVCITNDLADAITCDWDRP